MGWGDELICTGQAREMQDQDPHRRRVVILNRNNKPRWHELFDHNPRLVHPDEIPGPSYFKRFNVLQNGNGCRPYLRAQSKERYVYKKFKCPPGEIYLTPKEQLAVCLRGLDAGVSPHEFVAIEPHIKGAASPNKNWGFHKYQAVVSALPGVQFAQVSDTARQLLSGPNVTRVTTATFRHACGVISQSRAYVGPEGGLHHAAGAMDVPAVVIFGGFISPAQTGYDMHTNLYVDSDLSPCGLRVPCVHCRAALSAITVNQVVESLVNIIGGNDNGSR